MCESKRLKWKSNVLEVRLPATQDRKTTTQTGPGPDGSKVKNKKKNLTRPDQTRTNVL